jgi:hypothetical protein
VDDSATACSGLQKQSPLFNGPFKFFQVIDWSDVDFGGDVTWDNFYGYIP